MKKLLLIAFSIVISVGFINAFIDYFFFKLDRYEQETVIEEVFKVSMLLHEGENVGIELVDEDTWEVWYDYPDTGNRYLIKYSFNVFNNIKASYPKYVGDLYLRHGYPIDIGYCGYIDGNLFFTLNLPLYHQSFVLNKDSWIKVNKVL